jgi:TetR/AcrR family transcriptional repressor of lmrAB and yxaGH operons
MASQTRDRMIEAAVQGLQRHGLAGMSFTEVLADSGAARGAIYHHFPDGKRQLVAEAAERNGRDVRRHLAALPTDSPRAVIEAFLAQARPVVQVAAAGGGCAVAAVTVGPSEDNDELCQLAATAFASWSDAVGAALHTAGMPAGAAADTASLLIALLEGAQVLCRASGNLIPYDRAARAALALAA